MPRRPAQQREKIEHRLRKYSEVPVVGDGGRAVPFAELLSIGAVDHGQVSELRERRAERLIDQNLFRRIGDVIVAAHDERDLHRDVVRDHGEIVDRRSIRAKDDEVAFSDVAVRKGDWPVDEIRPARVAVWYAEADGERHAGGAAPRDFVRRQRSTAPVILERFFASERRGTHLVELLRRAEAPIRLVRLDQALDVSLVSRQVRALIDGILVPIEPEPIEAVEDCPRALAGAPRLVGVLDAEKELSAVALDVEPVEERGPRPADMQISRG